MMLWLILALMTAGALAAVVWPLLRAPRPPAGGGNFAVYRDQLEEIERDCVDGRIGHDEAEAARVEVSRRLLAAAAANSGAMPESGAGDRRRVVALIAVIVAMPLLASAFYAVLGSPAMPGQPAAGRDGLVAKANTIEALLSRIEDRLEHNPDDGRGWETVGLIYMQLARYDEAAMARRNAIKLLSSTPSREVDLGEALTAGANGVVTDAAKAAFDRALAVDGNHVKALFYSGLAIQQDGKPDEAARIWRGLIARAPAGAPWLDLVRRSLARVETPPATAFSAPEAAETGVRETRPRVEDVAEFGEMAPYQRQRLILVMVGRLAARLHEDGGDVGGWLRLLRAYMVLGERDKARAASGEARDALAREPEKLQVLDQGIKDLGTGG